MNAPERLDALDSGIVKSCSVEGCGKAMLAKTFCPTHYARFRRHGSPHITTKAPAGAGTIRPDGYKAHRAGGRETLEHRAIAERALGKRLPAGAEVHHVDTLRAHNSPGNLVICPSRSYHQLLHQRQRAMDACGNASWLKCVHCKQYDEPSNLTFYTNRNGCTNNFHAQCKREVERTRYHSNKEATS